MSIMNREIIFKYVTIWMQEALCETIEESDLFRTQLTDIWCDEMTKKERDAITEYVKPFMDRFYNTEEEYEALKAWNELNKSKGTA